MPKEVEIAKLRQTDAITHRADIVFAVFCRDGHAGGGYEASVVIPMRDVTPEREAGIREQLRKAYLDHRGQEH